MTDWSDKAKKLIECLCALSGERWSIQEKGANLELWKGNSMQTSALPPAAVCYLIGGVMLGKGLRLENYEAQVDQEKIKRSLEISKAFGVKAGRAIN